MQYEATGNRMCESGRGDKGRRRAVRGDPAFARADDYGAVLSGCNGTGRAPPLSPRTGAPHCHPGRSEAEIRGPGNRDLHRVAPAVSGPGPGSLAFGRAGRGDNSGLARNTVPTDRALLQGTPNEAVSTRTDAAPGGPAGAQFPACRRPGSTGALPESPAGVIVAPNHSGELRSRGLRGPASGTTPGT